MLTLLPIGTVEVMEEMVRDRLALYLFGLCSGHKATFL